MSGKNKIIMFVAIGVVTGVLILVLVLGRLVKDKDKIVVPTAQSAITTTAPAVSTECPPQNKKVTKRLKKIVVTKEYEVTGSSAVTVPVEKKARAKTGPKVKPTPAPVPAPAPAKVLQPAPKIKPTIVGVAYNPPPMADPGMNIAFNDCPEGSSCGQAMSMAKYVGAAAAIGLGISHSGWWGGGDGGHSGIMGHPPVPSAPGGAHPPTPLVP